MSVISSSNTSLPYNSYSLYLARKFGGRIHKITIDAGFTCPNRDGTKAYGGCTYCDNASFSPQVRFKEMESVSTQLEKGMSYVHKMNQAKKYIAYFQAFTNTYADVATLKQIYDQCLLPEVMGMAIGTRPDCLTPEIVELLCSYTKRFPVWLELGLQTIHEQTHQITNRWQTTADFYRALDLVANTPLEVSVHLILGLPGETWEMMMETAQAVGAEDIHTVKIHHLYVSPHSIMEKQWKEGKITVLDLKTYISLVIDFIERLPEHIVIERLIGELSRTYALAPQWRASKSEILYAVHQEFQRRGTRQGIYFQPGNREEIRQKFLSRVVSSLPSSL